jgi:hypothetical protein
MLINHQHKFIFIHVYKVAGTSVLNALENESYPDYVPHAYRPALTRFLRKFKLSPSFPMHMHSKARDVKAKLSPDIYDNYFKFAFVRNPWDWQVSLYEYGRQYKNHPQRQLMQSFRNFDEYLDWRVTEEKTLQKEFITDEAGNVIVDYIGRFEQLEQDFTTACSKVGLEVTLPKFNKTKSRKSYTDYYSDRTQKLIYDHFREDIDFFGYSFGA